jgi:hypothetical protein
MHAIRAERVETEDGRLQLVVEDRQDLGLERFVLVGVVGLTDDALGGPDARDDRAPIAHLVVTALVGEGQRYADRDRLDGLDGERHLTILSQGCDGIDGAAAEVPPSRRNRNWKRYRRRRIGPFDPLEAPAA